MSRAPVLFLKSLVAEELDEVGDAAGAAPFVVVPGDDFDEVAEADRNQIQAGSNSNPIPSASAVVSPIATLTPTAAASPSASSYARMISEERSC